MFRLIPPPLHRAILRVAHRLRHRWRQWRKTPIEGCSVIISDLSGAVLLLRHSYGPDVWSLPGGGLKSQENAESAARREVREELGIELATMTALGTITETISGAPHTAHLFAAQVAEHPQPDRREVIEARYFPAHSLPEPLGELARKRIAIWRERSNS